MIRASVPVEPKTVYLLPKPNPARAEILARALQPKRHAYASCGRRGNSDDGETYSDAYASSYGLEDGSVSATASVGNYRDTETVNFNANSVVVSAHESGSFNESGTASASTSGWYTTTDSNGDEIRVWKSKSKRDTIGPP